MFYVNDVNLMFYVNDVKKMIKYKPHMLMYCN